MNKVRVGQFEITAIATPGHASHHHVYHWEDNLFGGDVAGVRIGAGPPIPPFVPPELHVESWQESIDKIRAIQPARIYLPHFGVVENDVNAHLDVLSRQITHWSEWFRDRIRGGASEQQLIADFAEHEHDDLRAGGASQEEIDGYEAADPSHMAVGASLRYWKKYHPDEILGRDFDH
jgi:glyoxylase-like metal-dependent hydrolase (beta-lactamase superfamily II)